MFEDERCAHKVKFTQVCHECIRIGLGAAAAESRHSCHCTYQIVGKQCPQPTRQSEGGCAGCWLFGRLA